MSASLACRSCGQTDLQLVLSLGSLRAFEAVARRLNFSEAAEELHVTQSAVSRQIKGLEDTLRLRLFDRTPRSVELTRMGRELLPVLERMSPAVSDGHALVFYGNELVGIVSPTEIGRLLFAANTSSGRKVA